LRERKGKRKRDEKQKEGQERDGRLGEKRTAKETKVLEETLKEAKRP